MYLQKPKNPAFKRAYHLSLAVRKDYMDNGVPTRARLSHSQDVPLLFFFCYHDSLKHYYYTWRLLLSELSPFHLTGLCRVPTHARLGVSSCWYWSRPSIIAFRTCLQMTSYPVGYAANEKHFQSDVSYAPWR